VGYVYGKEQIDTAGVESVLQAGEVPLTLEGGNGVQSAFPFARLHPGKQRFAFTEGSSSTMQ
jgi:hypothetical protein